MKFSLFFLFVLVAVAVAQSPEQSGSSEEGIFDRIKDLGKKAAKGLKEVAKIVGKEVINQAKDVLTDGLRLNPTKEVQEALQSGPSTEGIFNATADLIYRRASELVAEEISKKPSHEGILTHVGPFSKLDFAQHPLYYQYDPSIHGDNPSHEGILGGLGGLVLNGLGGLIGGKVGDVIQGAGNVLGNLFFVVPGSPASQEGIFQELGNSGILTSAGQLITKGAARIAKTVIKGIFKPYSNLLGNIFLARGNYNGYANIQQPGKEAILEARAVINQYPEAVQCTEDAERNLTQLLDQYVKNGHSCVLEGEKHGKPIVYNVYDIVLDAVKRVEDLHREAGACFEKEVDQNKVECLDVVVPAQIKEHKAKIYEYGRELAEFVSRFSDVNTQFDICLTRHLGDVRSVVYNVVYDFHHCVDNYQQRSGNRKRQ